MRFPLFLLLVFLAVGEAAHPCRKKLPTTTTVTPNSTDVTETSESTNTTSELPSTTSESTESPSTTSEGTSEGTTELPTTTIDPKAPCMAEWSNMKPDDPEYLDSSSATSSVKSSEECGEVCMKDAKCAYAFFDSSSNCVTFPKFTVLDFDKNAEGSMMFKLFLNGTSTCSSVSLPQLATSKTRMYYPEGGSYWLFENIMDLISYACYNPELGYKRRKRSLFNWLFNF